MALPGLAAKTAETVSLRAVNFPESPGGDCDVYFCFFLGFFECIFEVFYIFLCFFSMLEKGGGFCLSGWCQIDYLCFFGGKNKFPLDLTNIFGKA